MINWTHLYVLNCFVILGLGDCETVLGTSMSRCE